VSETHTAELILRSPPTREIQVQHKQAGPKKGEHDLVKTKNKPKRIPPLPKKRKQPSAQTAQKDLSEQTEKSPDKLEHPEKQAS
jgi:hypothetical protein